MCNWWSVSRRTMANSQDWERFFFDPALTPESRHLSPEESHHAIRVLRMTKGDRLAVTNGKGLLVTGTLREGNERTAHFDITEIHQHPAPENPIALAVAPTKSNDRTEWLLEKVTEIGVQDIYFIHCQHSERDRINLDRFQKVIVGALKQSKQTWLPALHPLIACSEMVRTSAAHRFLAHADDSKPYLITRAPITGSSLILVGPEGGFSDAERALAAGAGFETVRLAPHRLRTETAALVACVTLSLALHPR